MGSGNSEFQAMVCASGREGTGIYQSRLGSAKCALQVITGTDILYNRKINNRRC